MYLIVGKDKILANFRGSSAKLGLFHFSTGSSAGSNLDETRLNFHPPLLFHQADLSPQFHLALNHGGRGRRRIPLLLFNHRPRLHGIRCNILTRLVRFCSQVRLRMMLIGISSQEVTERGSCLCRCPRRSFPWVGCLIQAFGG